jgi:hypothetical protein
MAVVRNPTQTAVVVLAHQSVVQRILESLAVQLRRQVQLLNLFASLNVWPTRVTNAVIRGLNVGVVRVLHNHPFVSVHY